VIRNSFIEDLNALECLSCTISGMANFFFGNVVVQHWQENWCITWEICMVLIMGSSFGQQIMQFSYDSVDEMYCDRGLVGELGAHVWFLGCMFNFRSCIWSFGATSELIRGLSSHEFTGKLYSSCSLICTICLICPALLCGKYLSVTRLKNLDMIWNMHH
jgi:hypothetical protein